MTLTVEHCNSNIGSLWTQERSIPGWCIAPPAFVCKSLDTRPTAAMGCCARPVTSGRGCWTPTGSGSSMGCRRSSAIRRCAANSPHEDHRRAVDGRGPLGPGPLLGCLVPGRQTPPQRGAGRVPTSQAPARPDSLLPRHVRVPARTGAVAGRQGPSRVVGAAGPPHSLSRRASPSGHAARRWGAAAARRAPKPGQRGSRRWRRHRLRVRREEARHRRRVHQAQHEAAKQVIAFAVRQGVGTLLVGDPKHITSQNVGRVQNLRLRQWRRTHLVHALRDKAERAGMIVRMVDERGSSSTCPVCRRKVPKPKDRRFSCPHCRFQGHRDLVGAANIAATYGGGPTSTALPVLVEHRRAGAPGC
jgi:IS605 OrfB family transposase